MKLAVITTAQFPYSHADVITARWHTSREIDRLWGWQGPRTTIASVYVDQFGSDDSARKTWQDHGVPIFPTIAKALTLGGDDLAVDGILLIGEHGDYPLNAYGQKLYPRKEFFDQIVEVFNNRGQSVPIFCDKHLSWNLSLAQEMVTTSQRLGFLLLGGSSVPHCRYLRNTDFHSADIEEVVSVFHRPLESYAFHSLEIVQSLIEDRPGGESGVQSMTAWVGDDLVKAQKDPCWPTDLIAAACTAQRVPPPTYQMPPYRDDDDVETPSVTWTLVHRDGLRVTHFRQRENPHGGFSVAIRRRGAEQIETVVPLTGTFESFVPHFACLAEVIENAFLTGQPPFPIQRTLLTTGSLEAMMRATQQSNQMLLTPQLEIGYQFSERREIPLLTAEQLANHPSCHFPESPS